MITFSSLNPSSLDSRNLTWLPAKSVKVMATVPRNTWNMTRIRRITIPLGPRLNWLLIVSDGGYRLSRMAGCRLDSRLKRRVIPAIINKSTGF